MVTTNKKRKVIKTITIDPDLLDKAEALDFKFSELVTMALTIMLDDNYIITRKEKE